MGQASLLLNDRMRTLQCRLRGAAVTAAQHRELCEIADGIAAASYHVQKWAFLLQGGPSGQARKPTRPSRCEEIDEAIASVHSALPRLMVAASEAQKGLRAAIKAHGTAAEAKLRAQGIPSQDLRALAPHLERYVLRLGRLSSAIRPPVPLREFVPKYFGPALGARPAAIVARFVG